MGVGSKKTWKRREESSDYEPRPSKEEKARRARKAVATHYRRHPAARERKKTGGESGKGGRGASPKYKSCNILADWKSRAGRATRPIWNIGSGRGGGISRADFYVPGPTTRDGKAAEMFATPQRGRKQREVGGTTTPCEFSALPPSSPPPASPEVPQRPQVSRSWVSPGEWDDPGSPLPSSAYERMPWPRLFKSLFGPKGDAEPDEEEMERFGFRNE
ncbi:hypothetical protein C8R44DRAFT_754586 [Mycena epipterygia]|nr:hypothetical protein C8R44DRAFT_754586 [Mycena epipterygia]